MFKINKQYFYLTFAILLFSLPSMLLAINGLDSIVGSSLKKLVFYLFSIAIIIFPLLIIKPKYYTLLCILLSPLLLFEVFNIQKFKAPSSEEATSSLFYTNNYEGKELLNSNLPYIFFFIVMILILIFLFIKLNRKFKLNKNIKKSLFLYSFLIFSVIYARDYKIAHITEKKATFYRKFDLSTSLFSVKVNKSFPVGNFFKLYNAKKGIRSIKNYQHNISKIKLNAIKNDTLNKQEIYVLVIGETARRSNFSLYDYDRNTNPELSKFDNLKTFYNVKSNANLTSISLPFIVTRSTPSNLNPKLNEPPILKAFEESGFKTYWLTNQAAGLDNVFAFYSRLANYYKNIAVSIDVAKHDEDLLPELDIVLNDKTTNKKFIVIHTLGSHYNYTYRYPKKYNHFKPSLSKGISLTGNSIELKEETINSYDNSILYTDFVLSSIIKRIEKTKSISYVYYISDHGENLYDDEDELLMHGYMNPKNEVIDIPLFIWHSNQYSKNYASKIINLENNSKSKIATINSFETLIDMANITIPNSNKSMSFANESFIEKPRFLLTPNNKILSLD